MKQTQHKEQNNMKSQDNQIEILNKIKGQLQRGDITAISKKAGFTKEYVGMVLNPANDYFNFKIVNEAVKVIKHRDSTTEKLLQEIL